MPRRAKRILAIDPGTRWMGVAVMQKGKLLNHGVEVIKRGSNPRENLKNARKAVLRLIRDFEPDILAVEKAFFANNSNAPLMKALEDNIRLIARRKKLKLVAFAPSSIKKFICGDGWAKKKQVAQAVLVKYPQLRVYYTQDRGWKEVFHQNMFDAVAVGLMASN